jgi:hypothetical protein
MTKGQVEGCAFCEHPADSREHSPAKWVYKWISRNRGMPGYRVQKGSGPLGVLQHVPDVMYPCCRGCNAWLNSNIENPVKNVLKQVVIGSPTLTELTVSEQVALATWFYKAAILTGDYPNRRAELRRTGQPGPDDRLWLGQMTRPEFMKVHPELRPIRKYFGKVQVPWANYQALSLCQGYCLTLRQVSSRVVILPPAVEQYLVPIWPPSAQPVPWPPQRGVNLATKESLDELFDAPAIFQMGPGGTRTPVWPPTSTFIPPQ